MTTAVETYRSTQTAPALTGIQHLGLTVRDIVASEAWYTEVLGLVRLFVEPHGTGDGYAVVMTRPGTGLFMGLDHHPDADRTRFNELRTGLDHFAIQVASREDIDEWVTRLDAMGVEHGAVFEATEPARRAQVTFRDPDGIPIELFWFGGREAEMDGLPQLPLRAGSRPRTTTEIPHSQLDQQPDNSRYVDAILAEALTWASVLAGPSAISVEGARALFLDGREFCHVHAQGDFSLHAALPLPLAAAAERAGWAEPHFLVRTGQAPPHIVMLYAPRDDLERDVVLRLVRASYEFALAPDPAHNPWSGASAHRKGEAMSIHVVEPAGGEPSGGGPIRCRIIEDGSHTQHRLGLIEAIVPPVPGGPPQHVHREHDELFIVTEGKLRFTSGTDSVDAEAGSCVTVPAGTPHTFSNPFGGPAKFLCTLTPDLYVEYFRDLGKLPVDERGLLDPADVGRTMAAYATEVIR